VNCFPLRGELAKLELSPRADPALFAATASGHKLAFDFVELGYIWHFTNVVTLRSLVMRETWRHVKSNYPGAVVRDEQ
jgi:hypothetical protein